MASSTKRKRTSIACKRCHHHRTRCDAASVGLPCSNCQRARHSDCQFIETKRTRGATGRFTSGGLGEGTVPPQQDHEEIATSVSPAASSIMTAREAQYDIDFEQLCRDGEEDSNTNSTIPGPPSRSPPWVESWYLSFVARATSNEHAKLFRSASISRKEPPMLRNHDHEAASDAIGHCMRSLPPPELVARLLDAYFRHFHIFCPLLDEDWVRSSFLDRSLPTVLLRCIMFIASIHCDDTLLRDLGYNDRIEAEDALFRKAKAEFDSDNENDNLTMLFSSYLLHYWSGKPTAFKDSLWWLAGAIRCAQSMGMHRSIRGSSASPLQRQSWRRIWWLLYIRDRQISISLDKPFLINDSDCDVEYLQEDDLSNESPATRAYVEGQANLSIAASRIFPLVSRCDSQDAAGVDSGAVRTAEAVNGHFHRCDDSFRTVSTANTAAPQNPLNIILRMTYEFYKILAYRILERKSLELADAKGGTAAYCVNEILLASKNVTAMFEEILMSFEARQFPMICVSSVFATMTVQFVYSKRPNLETSKDTLSEQLRFNLLGLRDFEDCHRLAHWIRKLFLRVRDKARADPAWTSASTTRELSNTTLSTEKRADSAHSSLFNPTAKTSLEIGNENSDGHHRQYHPELGNSHVGMPVVAEECHDGLRSALPVPCDEQSSFDTGEQNGLGLDFFSINEPELFRYQSLQIFADEFSADMVNNLDAPDI